MRLSLKTTIIAFATLSSLIGFVLATDATGRGDVLRLEVDAGHWPLRVLELAQATKQMVSKPNAPAYLAKIHINLPDVNPPVMTSVHYEFYFPATKKRISVGYAHTDVSLPEDQMEAARRAGVADVMKASMDAVFAPQTSELPPTNDGLAPTPLVSKPIALQDAYQLARRAGLTRAETIDLETNTKDPKAPVMMWTFHGQHTLADSKAVHIDALNGALIDEDQINATTRAEHDAEYAQYLATLRALVHPRATGGGNSSNYCTGGYVWDSSFGYCRAPSSSDPQTMPTHGPE
jgi:hypothetical protein